MDSDRNRWRGITPLAERSQETTHIHCNPASFFFVISIRYHQKKYPLGIMRTKYCFGVPELLHDGVGAFLKEAHLSSALGRCLVWEQHTPHPKNTTHPSYNLKIWTQVMQRGDDTHIYHKHLLVECHLQMERNQLL
jgi:hypothetical protein